MSAAGLPEWGTRVLLTIVLFLAYELGYWLHHYLCHRVPLFWEFHKVHHTANVLTPITAFRVHPVDTWLFVNVLALTVGAAGGIASYALGVVVHQYALTDTNLILGTSRSRGLAWLNPVVGLGSSLVTQPALRRVSVAF